VLPIKKEGAINVAGDNIIAFIDLEHGSVDSTPRRENSPETSPDAGRSCSASHRNARRNTVSKID